MTPPAPKLADFPHQAAPRERRTRTAPSSQPGKRSSEKRISFTNDEGRLVETVADTQGRFHFLVQGQSAPVQSVMTADIRVEPCHNLRRLWESGLLRFPSTVAPYGSTPQLMDEIKSFIRKFADLPHDWLSVIVLYVLMTWVYDRFTALPYLRFLGEPGTGKTRLLQICASICYKGMVASGNITGPALFRTIDLVRGTMAIDEADFKDSAEWSDLTKIINTGYKDGSPVIRCNSNNFDPEPFRVYGPKIISTRRRFEDEAIETRCLTLETKERKVPPHIPLQLPITFDSDACQLRNQLLQWRFDNYVHISAKEEGLRHLSPRAGEIGASLAAVAPDEESFRQLQAFLGRVDAGDREENPKSIVKQVLAEMQAVPSKTSTTVKDVAEAAGAHCEGMGLNYMSPKKVGGILRSLGYQPRKTNKGYVIEIAPGPPEVNV
jgi:hypothetical protein